MRLSGSPDPSASLLRHPTDGASLQAAQVMEGIFLLKSSPIALQFLLVLLLSLRMMARASSLVTVLRRFSGRNLQKLQDFAAQSAQTFLVSGSVILAR